MHYVMMTWTDCVIVTSCRLWTRSGLWMGPQELSTGRPRATLSMCHVMPCVTGRNNHNTAVVRRVLRQRRVGRCVCARVCACVCVCPLSLYMRMCVCVCVCVCTCAVCCVFMHACLSLGACAHVHTRTHSPSHDAQPHANTDSRAYSTPSLAHKHHTRHRAAGTVTVNSWP